MSSKNSKEFFMPLRLSQNICSWSSWISCGNRRFEMPTKMLFCDLHCHNCFFIK